MIVRGTTTADEFAARFVSFWAEPSGVRLRDLFSPDAVIRWPGMAAMSVPAYAAHMDALLAAMPSLKVEVRDYAGRDDLVFISWLASVSIQGSAREWIGVDTFRLQGGAATEEDVVYDRLALRDLIAGPKGR